MRQCERCSIWSQTDGHQIQMMAIWGPLVPLATSEPLTIDNISDNWTVLTFFQINKYMELFTHFWKCFQVSKCVGIQKVTEYFQWRLRQLSGMSLTLWMTMTGAHSGTFHTQVWQFLLAPCIWRLWNYQHRGCTVFSSVSILYVSICRTNPRQFVGHWYFPLYRYSCPDLVVPYSEELISRPCVAENRFLLVLQMRMSTKNAMGCKIDVASYTHTASAPQKTFPRGFVQKQVTWISQQKIQCIAMQCLHI